MRYTDNIIDKFGRDYVIHNDEYTYNCPFCFKRRGKADNDRKLYVSGTKGLFHCFKCDTRGSVIPHISVKTSGIYSDIMSIFSVDNNSDEDSEDNIFYVPNLKITKGSIAYEYCIDRGITEDNIDFYNIRLGSNELFGRIVIPNMILSENGSWTDMFSARSYLDQKPKYKNPVDCKKSDIVFNLHNINEGGDIYVVEGAITAIMAGREAVAVYGCHPSDEQVKKILSKNPKNVYAVLDNDEAGRPGNEMLAEKLSRYINDGNVYMVYMPYGKDAADIGETRFKEYVKDNRILYGSSIYASVASYIKMKEEGIQNGND